MIERTAGIAQKGLKKGLKTVNVLDKLRSLEGKGAQAPQPTQPPPLPDSSPESSAPTDVAHRRVADMANQLDEFLPIFEQAGYVLHGLEIEMGISPKLVPRFRFLPNVSEEDRADALRRAQGNRMARVILEALLKAGRLTKHLRVGELHFLGLEVVLGVVPTVRILMRRPT